MMGLRVLAVAVSIAVPMVPLSVTVVPAPYAAAADPYCAANGYVDTVWPDGFEACCDPGQTPGYYGKLHACLNSAGRPSCHGGRQFDCSKANQYCIEKSPVATDKPCR
jgi:hypothetical protein